MQDSLRIRRAQAADTAAIMAVMDVVTEQMRHNTWFVPSDADFVARAITDEGLAVVAENDCGQIVAAFIVYLPGEGEGNLGCDLHLPKDQLHLVAHMDTVIVLPEYRGHRLQQRLLAAAEAELTQCGCRYLMCTIHPENTYSLGNMKAAGYEVMLTKEKYGGKLRHVLLKTSEPWSAQQPVVLVSACLFGVNCRYNGGGEAVDWIKALAGDVILIPVCPEVMGGLPMPREPAERSGDAVVTKCGADVTAQYAAGAQHVLQLAQWYGGQSAILKERSPSCGSGMIYDGTHSGRLISGDGWTAELLKQHNIRVFGESEERKFKDFMAECGIL